MNCINKLYVSTTTMIMSHEIVNFKIKDMTACNYDRLKICTSDWNMTFFFFYLSIVLCFPRNEIYLICARMNISWWSKGETIVEVVNSNIYAVIFNRLDKKISVSVQWVVNHWWTRKVHLSSVRGSSEFYCVLSVLMFLQNTKTPLNFIT